MYKIILGRGSDEREEFGEKGTVLLGKQYVTMGKTTSLSNPIMVDVVKPHTILVAGKRGSGKSYLLGVMIEGMLDLEPEICKNLGIVVMDPMGIYWTTKYPNFRQDDALREWGLKPKSFEQAVKVFVPHGHFTSFKDSGIPVDVPFSLPVNVLSDQDWINVFNVKSVSPIGVAISRIIIPLKEKYDVFGFKEIKAVINVDKKCSDEVRNALFGLFSAAESWGLFSEKGTSIKELVVGGQMSIIDLSPYAHTAGTYSIRALVVGLISKIILEERMKARRIEELADIERGWAFFDVDYGEASKKVVPLVWIFIDEAHEFLPESNITPATNALIQVIREGRQPGISMVLATQQPGKIHSDVITQADIVISNRVTARLDISALNNIMQSYLPGAITKYFDNLPRKRGAAIVLDDKLEKMYPFQIRPRITWHGGGEPTALRENRAVV